MPDSAIVLVGRVLLSILFLVSGLSGLADIGGGVGYFESLGLPAPLAVAWATAIFETLAGLAVLVGFQTRIFAYLLALFCVAAGYLGHYGQGGEDPLLTLMHTQSFMKDVGLAGAFLVLGTYGPGSYSIDGRRAVTAD
jgi:putative oxidoreductase